MTFVSFKKSANFTSVGSVTLTSSNETVDQFSMKPPKRVVTLEADLPSSPHSQFSYRNARHQLPTGPPSPGQSMRRCQTGAGGEDSANPALNSESSDPIQSSPWCPSERDAKDTLKPKPSSSCPMLPITPKPLAIRTPGPQISRDLKTPETKARGGCCREHSLTRSASPAPSHVSHTRAPCNPTGLKRCASTGQRNRIRRYGNHCRHRSRTLSVGTSTTPTGIRSLSGGDFAGSVNARLKPLAASVDRKLPHRVVLSSDSTQTDFQRAKRAWREWGQWAGSDAPTNSTQVPSKAVPVFENTLHGVSVISMDSFISDNDVILNSTRQTSASLDLPSAALPLSLMCPAASASNAVPNTLETSLTATTATVGSSSFSALSSSPLLLHDAMAQSARIGGLSFPSSWRDWWAADDNQ